MPTPLEYERFGLSQNRFDRQGEQFDENMNFRRMVDERNFGYRTERDDSMMDWRREQAARSERLALLRMLPQRARMGMLAGQPQESSPDRQAREYEASMDRQTAHNYAAVEQSAALQQHNFAEEAARRAMPTNGLGFRIDNQAYVPGQGAPTTLMGTPEEQDATFAGLTRQYAAQQQAEQMRRLQARGSGIGAGLAAQLEADQKAARDKAIMDRAAVIGRLYGHKPGDIYRGLDRTTGETTIPGAHVPDPMHPGEFINEPAKKFKLPPHHLRDLEAVFSPPMEETVADGPARMDTGSTSDALDPARAMARRIHQVAARNRYMPAVVEGVRAEMATRGRFTEQELLDALKRHDEAFMAKNLREQAAYWHQADRDRATIDAEEARPFYPEISPMY